VQIWGAFLTGLIAGGASCAAVQGGLLAGLLLRRTAGTPAGTGTRLTAGGPGPSSTGRRARPPADAPPEPAGLRDDLRPVTAFLAGKLASHTLLGVALGLLGAAVQIGFRTRAALQIIAGVVMVLLAADLLGVSGVRRLVPQPPAVFARLVRRRARSSGLLAPALLGVATVLIPCGVTLGVELLAVSSGSPWTGAAIMAAFVAGTSPLFAVLGFAARRSGAALRGRLASAAAVAVAIVGVLSINTGLVLAGSRHTLSAAATALTRGGPPLPPAGDSASVDPFGRQTATVGADGVQQITISALSGSYRPSRVQAKAGVRTRLTVRTDRTRGCTRAFVIPDANIERILPETGNTEIDLGVLQPGELRFTCSMGMYRGSITVT